MWAGCTEQSCLSGRESWRELVPNMGGGETAARRRFVRSGLVLGRQGARSAAGKEHTSRRAHTPRGKCTGFGRRAYYVTAVMTCTVLVLIDTHAPPTPRARRPAAGLVWGGAARGARAAGGAEGARPWRSRRRPRIHHHLARHALPAEFSDCARGGRKRRDPSLPRGCARPASETFFSPSLSPRCRPPSRSGERRRRQSLCWTVCV